MQITFIVFFGLLNNVYMNKLYLIVALVILLKIKNINLTACLPELYLSWYEHCII